MKAMPRSPSVQKGSGLVAKSLMPSGWPNKINGGYVLIEAYGAHAESQR